MNIIHMVEVVFFFSFMIFIHETGHFLAARFFGVEVEEFALGFGPTFFSKQWGKTLYALRAIPLGGFCKMKGGDLSSSSAEDMHAKPAEEGDFLFTSWWKRVVILLAGPGMNFISALVLTAGLFICLGEPMEVAQPLLGFVPPTSLAAKAGLKKDDLLLTVNGKVIDNLNTAYDDLLPDYGKTATVTYQRKNKVETTTIVRGEKPASPWSTSDIGALRFLAKYGLAPAATDDTDLGISDRKDPIVGQALLGQPARNAGLQDGDEITQVNGQKVGDWSQLAYMIRNASTDKIQVEFIRAKAAHTITIPRIFNGYYKAIGISPVDDAKPEMKKVSFITAVDDAANYTLNLSKLLVSGIVKLFTGQVSLKDNVAGPVTIMRMMYQNATQGLQDLIHSVIVISLILFVMNLLPIPVVDGGQIVLCLIEAIKRSPVSVKAQMIYQQVGFVLVVGLMALTVFNDFKNIFLEMHNHIR